MESGLRVDMVGKEWRGKVPPKVRPRLEKRLYRLLPIVIVLHKLYTIKRTSIVQQGPETPLILSPREMLFKEKPLLLPPDNYVM